jgi:hypothetical protein
MPDQDQPIADQNATTKHEYDNPAITPLAFLLSVMRDHAVPLRVRIEAASMALPLTCLPPGTTRVHPDLVIRVPPLEGEPSELSPPIVQ